MSIMVRLQAFKYELKPNGEQQRQMRRFAGSCRFVYNQALVLQKERYERGEKKLGYAGLCKELTEWKAHPQRVWLNETPSQALQQSLKNLEWAYKNFFEKRADFPRFKKKGQHDSFRFPQGCKLDQANSRVYLPKLGWLKYRNSRDVMGTVSNITVSANGGKWFVSIQTEREVEQPAHPANSIIGIDVGITRFATLSDGSHIEPLNTFRKHQKRLARYQRAMSRKTKFSSNWKKAKARVQRIHSRIGNARRDFLHKASTQISQNHAIVCIEDLQVQNMSRSAAGTRETPGKNVRAKSGLNRAILDQGWAEFRRQLEYKQAWRGGEVLVVPPHHTSQTCPACSRVSADNRQTQARFACVECGFEKNADLVGAINILERGHRLLACGERVLLDRSMKQEPTEATLVQAA
jgi:putative transposase